MILVDDIKRRDDDKWRTRDMFALGGVARGDAGLVTGSAGSSGHIRPSESG